MLIDIRQSNGQEITSVSPIVS